MFRNEQVKIGDAWFDAKRRQGLLYVSSDSVLSYLKLRGGEHPAKTFNDHCAAALKVAFLRSPYVVKIDRTVWYSLQSMVMLFGMVLIPTREHREAHVLAPLCKPWRQAIEDYHAHVDWEFAR